MKTASCVLSLTLFVSAFLFSPSVLAAKKTEVVMGFNPAENSESTELNGKLFAEYYKAKTGMPLKTFVATDYTALVEALRSGKIDFAWLPPFSYVKAEQVADAQVLLKSVRRGKAVFYSAIITRADKGISKIGDLKGRTMAWVDPASASGHVFPKANLMAKGLIDDPDKFFGRQIFAGSHDALVLAVLNGTVDAGATFCNDAEGLDGSWMRFLKKPEDQKRIKVVYVTDPLTGDSMATTKKFFVKQNEIVSKTVALLEGMGKDAEGQKILKALYQIDSMVPAKSEDYEPLRAAAKKLNLE